MPEDERQNSNKEEHDYDDKPNHNIEAGNRTNASDNMAQVNHNSSEVTDHNLQNHTMEAVEVDQNDGMRVEELSHELLSGESSNENLGCRVIYEFPSSDECEGDSHPDQLRGLFRQTGIYGYSNDQYRDTSHIVEEGGIATEEIDTKNLNAETIDDRYAAGTSREVVRKRKKDSIPVIQNKKHKDIQSCSEIEIEEIDESSENTSDEFADVEDNAKDSSVSDLNETSSSDEKVKDMRDLKSGSPHKHVIRNKSITGDKSIEVNHEKPSSGTNSSENNKPVDKTSKKFPVASSLKGETLPAFKLSAEDKAKFESSMPTILETRESESDEQISQPNQNDKNETSSSDKKIKDVPDLKSGFPHKHIIRNKLITGDKSIEVNHEKSSSGTNSSEKNKPVDKTSKKFTFASSLKGETLPAFKLSAEDKAKFESSMPTILETRESESDEQISQPNQNAKNNTFKMKTKVSKRKDRCNVCNVRLGLCAIQCRCGGYYCARHRYDREHNCTYDYKTMGAAEIQKNNPRIVAEKVRKL